MRPFALRCDHLRQPLVLDSLQPFLSWQQPNDMCAVKVQVAYEGSCTGVTDWLVIDRPGLRWPGAALQAGMKLRWRLRLADEAGHETAWSAWSCFACGPDPQAWPAVWMTGDVPGFAPIFRASFSCRRQDVEEVMWYVAALGVPVLWCNEQRISEPGLADYQQDPRWRVEYRCWSVPIEILGDEDNSIELHLGGGFHERQGYGQRCCSTFLLLRLKDGSRQVIAQNPHDWKQVQGPLIRDDPYDGVLFDQRYCAGDSEAQAWPVTVCDAPAGSLHAALTANPGIRERRQAVAVHELHDSCLVYDFGTAIVGGLHLRGEWWGSEVTTLRYAEECTADGHLLIRGNRQALNCDRHIATRGQCIDFMPDMANRGFRYCEVSRHGLQPKDMQVSAVRCHDAVEQRASFRCSHAGLNELFIMCVRTFEQNLVGMLRDCPQRDERLGWLGDAHAVMPAVLLTLEAEPVLRRWCTLIYDTWDTERHIRTAPMAPAEGPHLRRQWHQRPLAREELHQDDNVYTAAGTLLPVQLAEATGDCRLLAQYFDDIVAHLLQWRSDPQWPLLAASRHGDHAAFPVDRDRKTPKPLVSQAVLLMEVEALCDWAERLNRTVPALVVMKQELRAAMQQHYAADFINPASSQGTLVIGLGLELVEDIEAARGALRERLRADAFAVGTGIILTRLLLQVLARHDLMQEAWQMVTRTDDPGWLWMVGGETGTLFENFVDDWKFVSRNQPALGVVAEWMLTDLVGLRPVDGRSLWMSKTWALSPPHIEGLDHIEVSLPCAYGPVQISWQRQGDAFTVDYSAPGNLTIECARPN